MAQESAPLPEQPLKKSTDTVGYPAFFVENCPLSHSSGEERIHVALM